MPNETPQLYVQSGQSAGDNQQPVALHHLSHDLRSPLNSILGFAEFLLEGLGGELTDSQTEDVQAIFHSGQVLLRLISTLVDLSKLEADRLEFIFESVNLFEAVDTIIQQETRLNQLPELALISTLSDDLPCVWADLERVRYIISSLIQFGYPYVKAGQFVCAATHDDESVTLVITLEGVTIAPEKMAHVFELAAIYDETSKRHKLGVGGVTMPLAYQFTRALHGKLWYEQNDSLQFGLTLLRHAPATD